MNLKNLFSKKKSDDPAGGEIGSGDGKGGVVGAVTKLFDKNEKEVAKLRPMVDKVNALGPELLALTDEELKARSLALRERFKEEVTERLGKFKDPATGEPYGWQELDTELSWTDDYNRVRREAEKAVLDELMPEAFALVREAGTRTIGLRHFDVQMIGGATLHTGRISEMRTGEGKTLVATLPVYLNALSGRGAHVITTNDYLAERDANWMRPIYEFLGLSVSFLSDEMDYYEHNDERRNAYRSDVLYATNHAVGFDYLRDNMARSSDELVQRSLNFAIVDEVDNILIDEARTPLIISAQVAKTDRALRRQQMAKTCDGVARKLMPAVTDREVDNLLDSLTVKGKIDINGLMDDILKRGAFTAATEYLVDAYLLSEKSARVDNAARLLDVADEFFESGLISADGRARLEAVAINAVHPAGVRTAWDKEVARVTEPLARAYADVVALEFSFSSNSEALANALSYELALPADGAAGIVQAMEDHEDKPAAIANVVAEEMARRGLIDESAIELLVASLLEVPMPQHAEEAPRKNESADAVKQRHVEKVATSLRESVHPVLIEAALQSPGNLQDANALIQDALPADDATVGPGEVRTIIEALEQIGLRGLLPFESSERLWETVRLTQGREALRREVSGAIGEHLGDAARKISDLTENYGAERTRFLKEQAEALRQKLPGHEPIAQRAQSGENVADLRKLLLADLTKSGPFADAMKAAKNFISEQNRAHQEIAGHLAEEMAQWVEVPRDASRTIALLLSEGGRIDEVRERVHLTVRDYPGENTELPALLGESTKQLQAWRAENADALLDQIGGLVSLPSESAEAIRFAIEDGEYSTGFDNFIGEQLLTATEVAALTDAIEEFGARWDEFKADQNARLLEGINATVNLSQDAADSLQEVLGKPVHGALDAALFQELAADAVSRHLEPLLTEENAEAFAEEVKRRIPLAKEVQNRLRRGDFANRSGEQLQRALVRLVERSFEVMPFEDFKRIVRNLGWLTEKDEKRRQAALSDMGTLIAEREAGTPAFTDPDGFLDTCISTEILADEEAAIVTRAMAERPDDTLSATIDRVLRLPAERRRRLAEAKLQEVQPVLDQAIRAHALFQREVNYVIDTNPENGKREIIIVDEFTGRKMHGRRYSEGLHEALEAKHGLEVQLESQTVATITIQNYFRLYNKLAGMTGTAKTEEAEFAKTYGMEVVSIPTNRTVRRKDWPDVVYKTAEAKMRAITFEILEHHCAGQPVLVGTRSVEVSERMSERLKAQTLQTLALSHLVKTKLWEDKNFPDAQKQEIFQTLRVPLLQQDIQQTEQGRGIALNLMHVKNIAKTISMQPDPLHEENVSKLLSLFTIPNVDRERLTSALRVGLPHNVLNAKNHRNEARIIAEAARPGSVTIATNMAGRGVDIVLGGTLDVESRWRVMTLQALVRQLQGKTVHVRSRNNETTEKYEDRLSPQRLQDLCWVQYLMQRVNELEEANELEGQAAKEMRDTLAQELTTADLKNKVRSRVRRLGLLEKLPLDSDPLTDDEPLEALNAELQRLMGYQAPLGALRDALANGIATQSSGRDVGELIVLHALSLPLGMAQNAIGRLLETLATIDDLDHLLLEAAAGANAERGADFDAAALAEQIPNVTAEWVTARLKQLNIHDSPAARHKLSSPPAHGGEVEINEAQLGTALGEFNLGTQWLRERLRGWKLVKNERAYDATPEMQELLGDTAVVHYRLDKAAAEKALAEWQRNTDEHRDLVMVEVPNLILLSDIASLVGGNAPFLNPEWLHQQLAMMGIIDENDVMQAQMMGQAQDEQGNVHEMPIDVLVYRIRLGRVLAGLAPTLREAVAKVGKDPQAVLEQLGAATPWAPQFIDADWVQARVTQLGDLPAGENVGVFIETGVSGQSADIVLESEPRAEDIAHTSEQEAVKGVGGLHIVGTERHESRRIDNQLRGRAGRQGDPGSSRFYVSLEDELWRLFGVRGQRLLNAWDEDEAVEHSMISKSIERAQKKVELNHFESRKHVLQYDDVMNVQREVIYRERRRALMGGDLRDTVLDMAQQAAVAEVEKFCPRLVRPEEWEPQKAYAGLGRLLGASLVGKHLKVEDLTDMHWMQLKSDDLMAQELFDVTLHDSRSLYEVVGEIYTEREAQLGEPTLRNLERWQVTRSIDEHWMEHLAEMDYLRDAIWQEGYAQKEPIGVYRQEGFALFQKMLGEIRREVTESIFSFQAQPQVQQSYAGPQMLGMQEGVLTQTLPMDNLTDDGAQLDKDADGDDEDEPVVLARSATFGAAPPPQTQTRATPPAQSPVGPRPSGALGGAKVGRNDPCPCGSGKKYKKCCLPKEQGVTV